MKNENQNCCSSRLRLGDKGLESAKPCDCGQATRKNFSAEKQRRLRIVGSRDSTKRDQFRPSAQEKTKPHIGRKSLLQPSPLDGNGLHYLNGVIQPYVVEPGDHPGIGGNDGEWNCPEDVELVLPFNVEGGKMETLSVDGDTITGPALKKYVSKSISYWDYYFGLDREEFNELLDDVREEAEEWATDVIEEYANKKYKAEAAASCGSCSKYERHLYRYLRAHCTPSKLKLAERPLVFEDYYTPKPKDKLTGRYYLFGSNYSFSVECSCPVMTPIGGPKW